MGKLFLILFALCIAFFVHAQDLDGRLVLGKAYAEKQVRLALKNTISFPFTDTLIKTSEEAIAFAEPILFKKFRRRNIIRQRPYEVYFVDGYWFIAGTLPKGTIGGTFDMIVKSEKGQVISIARYQ